MRMIAEHLTKRGIPTPTGKTNWSVSTIMSILQNEKYKGDALLQKTYVADFLTKRTKKNRGELPQYYIENSHPAIIEPEMFELVQNEIARRRPRRRQLHRSSPFNAKIICGCCGGFYGRKVWHSGSRYQKSIWQCNHKYDNANVCSTPNLSEEEICEAFVLAFTDVLQNKDQHMANLEKLLSRLSDSRLLEKQLDTARAEHAELLGSLRRYMEENTRQIQDQEEYNRRFSEMDARCKEAEEKTAGLEKAILDQLGRKEQTARSMAALKRYKGNVTEFDSDIWNTMVESVAISPDKVFTFQFRDGTEVSVKLPSKVPKASKTKLMNKN